MLHQNVVSLLEKYGAKVHVLPPAFVRPYSAWLLGHRLEWGLDVWTKRIRDVAYYKPGVASELTSLLRDDGAACGNGTLVKRFIAVAVAVRKGVGGVAVEYGPDGRHAGLAPSLRARHLGWNGPRCNVRTPEALALGRAFADGSTPAGIVLDWLKENRHLAEV